jgi:signal transduction histidine kinase
MTSPDPPSVVVDRLLDVLVRLGRQLSEARRLLVAVEGAEGMRVRAVEGSGPGWERGAAVTETVRLPDNLAVRVETDPQADGGIAVTVTAHGGARAIVGRTATGRRVLMIADGTPGGRHGETLGPLVEMAGHLVAAEGTAGLGMIRDSLREREEERQRWARELHDDTLQQLGALQVLLSSALQRASSAGAPANEDLVAAVRHATELLISQTANLRQLIAELRPATLDELGLGPPLRALAQRTEELSGIPVSLHISLRYSDGIIETRLLPDIELAIYRVVQEALTNIRRHSTATRAAITLIEDDETITAEITDNGHGFDPNRAAGFGLEGMHERAELAGGTLEVVPARSDGRGTTVRLIVPAKHRRPM